MRSIDCPHCGGSGGGPFGRWGSAWDTEAYVCPGCEGLGVVRSAAAEADVPARPLARPLVKAPATQPGARVRRSRGSLT